VHPAGDSARLDRLAQLAPDRLNALFAASSAPQSLELLEGDPVCRGLIRGGRLARRWAASPASPWIGKSFTPLGDDRLLGHNRLRLLGGSRALAFSATIGPSRRDGRDALLLRYDGVGTTNPWWVRRIHDELREVEPGLLAGPVMWLRRRRTWTLCWFAIDTAEAAIADRAR
jgi:hypothetical protein